MTPFSRSLGIAAGPNRVVVVVPRRGAGGWSLAHCSEGPGGTAEAVLRGVPPNAPRAVGVALVPQLASTKLVSVPPLGRSDLGVLVQQNARRFFLVGDRPLVADAVRVGGAGRDGAATALAVCAEDAAVESVERAAAAAHRHLAYATAAPVAVAEAVRVLVRGARRRRLVVALLAGPWCELAVVDRGILTALEPCRVPGSPAERSAMATRIGELAHGGAPGRGRAAVVIAAAEPAARDLRDALDATGVGPAVVALPGWAAQDPYVLAAFGASLPREDAPHLLRAPARRAWGRRMRRRAVALAGAGLVCLVAAAAVHLKGLTRETDALAERRQALGRGLEDARARVRALELWRTQAAALAEAERARVAWAPVLTDLAQALPPTAYVVALHGRGDHIQLSGVAASAAAAVPALEAATAFRDVRLRSAVRAGGRDGPERFEIELRLAPRAAAGTEGSASR